MKFFGRGPHVNDDLREVDLVETRGRRRAAREEARLARARMGVNLRTISSWDAETRRRVADAIKG